MRGGANIRFSESAGSARGHVSCMSCQLLHMRRLLLYVRGGHEGANNRFSHLEHLLLLGLPATHISSHTL